MKKTVTVNLNGRVFTMDDDAYRLLDNYLNNLRIYFRKEEGSSEIIADFEARIEELFSEKTRSGCQVITIEMVEEVIARVGKPTDFADKEDVKEEKQTQKQTHFTEPKEGKKKFYRNIDDKMFGGVCSGIAAYFGWNVVIVRIVFIVILFSFGLHNGIPHGFPFWGVPVFLFSWIIPAYVLAWVLCPAAHTAEQKLQMHGKPVTLENIGKTVSAKVESVASKGQTNWLNGFVNVFVTILKIFLTVVGCLVGFALLFAFVVAMIVLIATFFGTDAGLSENFPEFLTTAHPVPVIIAFLLVLGIPVVALINALIAHLTKTKPLNRLVKWVLFVVWILALVLLLFTGYRMAGSNWLSQLNYWSYSSDRPSFRGNGVFSEKTYIVNEPITSVEIGGMLYANLQIEQIQSDTSSIEIRGDENLIDRVKYDVRNDRLILSSTGVLRSRSNLIILLRTNNLKSIQSDILGNIQLNRAFTGKELEIGINGPGKFYADSLYVQSLTVRSDGVASVNVSGKANKARFELSGAGKIAAFELPADTVYAHIDGVGSIQCNPTEYLGGHLSGVGKITYKEEPKIKNVTSEGIGKIRRR